GYANKQDIGTGLPHRLMFRRCCPLFREHVGLRCANPTYIHCITHRGVMIPSSSQMASTRRFTSSRMRIGRPHSRVVSPRHLLVASKPILEPKPEMGEAKSR